MKTLKTLSIAAGLAFVTVQISAQTPAQPQQKMDPQQAAQKMTAQLKQNVTGITPEQEQKIMPVEQEYAKGMMDARSSSGGDRDAMRSKMEPLRQTRDSKIKAILTPEQQAQYEKMRPMGHAPGGEKGGN